MSLFKSSALSRCPLENHELSRFVIFALKILKRDVINHRGVIDMSGHNIPLTPKKYPDAADSRRSFGLGR